MDKRIALAPGTLLEFPGLKCRIEEEVGRGSNAIVYRGWYADHHGAGQRHAVLVKELFPLHPKRAIYRNEDGSIDWTPEGAETYEIHRRSFESGNAAHLALLEKHPDQVGANLNTYAFNHTLYTVLGFSGGRSMTAELDRPAPALRPLAERILKLLDALEAFHDSGMLHLDIAPDNVLLLGDGRRERVMLIDYNSCMRMDEAGGNTSAAYSIKPGYTAPEIRGGRLSEICAGTDLYSVTAVFYSALSGAPLTPFQMIRPTPPDISACPCMEEMPETVRSWVQSILRRGLHTLPARRYQSIEELREDLFELLDRIDGVGITHWALWEAGRRNAQRAVRENPSLAFIRDDSALFPSMAEYDGETAPVETQLGRLMADETGSALLIAGGGMGKTTAMLRAALGQPARYTPARPAVAYLSLYGWRDGERDYILNRILETLRFKAETRSFEDARKALMELLDSPPNNRGDAPVLFLLLDGLNEAAGDAQSLIDELLRLSAMRGVRLLVSTRTDESALPFKRLRLAPLEEEDVREALSGAGLLLPESQTMRQLLRTPLMLSIFIESARAEQKQLTVRTQDELMRAYFAALLEKETASMPENGEARWRIEAALELVLPALAREMNHRGQALDDAQLLPVVERCYRLFDARMLRRAFPKWVGHSVAIRAGARNAEEWYGRVVHELLWKRLGLLVRDDRGRYQISHQIIADYLLGVERENRRRIVFRRRLQQAVSGIAAVCIIGLCTLLYARFIRPTPYDEALAEDLFAQARQAYVTAGLQCEDMAALVTCAADAPELYSEQYDGFIERNESSSGPADETLELLEQTLESGSVMPWSGKPMDGEACAELLSLPADQGQDYLEVALWLSTLVSGDVEPEVREGVVELIVQLVDDNARNAALLYRLACEPHLTGPFEEDPAGDKAGVGIDTLIPIQNEQMQEIMALTPEEAEAERERISAEMQQLNEAISREIQNSEIVLS